MPIIELCQAQELIHLRQLATKTFIDTYGIHNTPEVMTAYLAAAFSDKQLLSELNNPESEFHILKVGDAWVGYLKVNEGKAQTEARTDNALELERIYVDRDFQGNGYGKLLLNKAMEVGQIKQKDRVWLGVWQKNPNAIQFYESQGFAKNGTHVFVIGGEEQLDWVMEKEVSIEQVGL
jgi:ribosomal protein S18 acetylase RimI-like enzyme